MKQLGGIFAILGAILLFISFREGVASLKPSVDLYADETNVSEIGYFDMVEAEVWAVFDCFASEVTKENGVKKDEDFYYIIPAYNGDDMYYIGVKVNDKSYKTYDKIIDITYEYMMDYSDDLGTVTATTQGCLKKMDSKVKKYYYEWFEEMEWFDSEAEMKEYALPLYIDSIARPDACRTTLLCGLGGVVIGVILFVLGLSRDKKKEKKSKDQSYVVINGVSYPKSAFQHVNQCIYNQERIFAAQELHEITGVSLDEAGKILDNWNKYYY